MLLLVSCVFTKAFQRAVFCLLMNMRLIISACSNRLILAALIFFSNRYQPNNFDSFCANVVIKR